MIKLKIGDNFLLTTHKDAEMKNFIIYMMGCFKLSGKTAIGLDLINHQSPDYMEYFKVIRETNPSELYVLINVPDIKRDEYRYLSFNQSLRGFLYNLKAQAPTVKPRVIRINNMMDSKEYRVASQLYNTLILDKKNLLSRIDKLDEYKTFSNRYKAIPGELKVINDNIRTMSKEKKVCDRIITLKDLEYLQLIDEAHLEGENLVLTIKPLPIYASEPFGKCFDKRSYENNKYLFRAASYLYRGYDFGMVGTRILVRPDFRPEFIETVDHQFDDMFARNNWSNIGYLHFGKGHLCGGEFNDVMAHTSEHGLEYYFICLKQYITTANMRDYAGRKVWWYPIYDKQGKMVYCAGLDILRDYVLNSGISREEKEKIEKMSWEELQTWRHNHKVRFGDFNTQWGSDSVGSYSGKDDNFLEVCKVKDPALYEEIMKGARYNG